MESPKLNNCVPLITIIRNLHFHYGRGELMLSPKQLSNSWSAEAFELVRHGEYHRALGLLHNVEVAGSTAMRARAWERLGRNDRVIAECTRRAETAYDAHENVLLLELHANALLEQRDDGRARAALERQRHIAAASRERLLVAYAAYCETLMLYIQGDVDAAWQALWHARKALSSVRYALPKKPHHVDLLAVQARLHHVEGWLQGHGGVFDAQEASFIEAARCAADERCRDRTIEGTILANLAVLMKRKWSIRSRSFLTACVAEYPVSRLSDANLTDIRLALQNAWRVYGGEAPGKMGGPSAPTLSLRLSDRVAALLFDEWKASQAFIEDCRLCVAMLFEINVSCAPGRELCDILELAALLAPFDLALAHRAREIYRSRQATRSRLICSLDAPNELANRYFADACLAKAEGDLDRADALYAYALQAVVPGQGHPLPALAGLERFTISRSPADLEPARAFVAAFPRTAFSRRLQTALASADLRGPTDFPYLGMYGVKRAAVYSGRVSRAETLTSHFRADRTA